MKRQGYIFIDTKTNQFVGMDQASGGYPYTTDLLTQIYVWYDIEKAYNYYLMFMKDHDWKLVRFDGLKLSNELTPLV